MRSGEVLPSGVMGRLARVRFLILCVLTGLLLYLFDMQILRSQEFRAAAQLNSLKRIEIVAPRGLIYDRDGRVLVKNRPGFEAVLLLDRVQSREASLRRARGVLGLDEANIDRLRRELARPRRPELLVKRDLSLAEVASLEARSYEWPEFEVREGLVRSYPHGSAAAHALGHMGEIRMEQLSESRYLGYRAGDVIGQSGIEARYEPFLRGKPGYRTALVDSRGRQVRLFETTEPPVPGLDLELGLDLDVQQAAEQAFREQKGAAVALDARTGEVLALVSRPAFDPNAFSGRLTSEQWRRYSSDPDHPLFDRALLGKLPPGSVYKIVNSIAGLQDRVWSPEERISCTGRTVIYGDSFRCWRPGGHGSMSFHEAFRSSCNVFFYHRGQAAGIERLARWSHRLGLGDLTRIDVDSEGRGVVPDPAWKRRVLGQPWWPGETISVAIGQGALGVSVLQVASMMQVVATGSRADVPFLVRSVGGRGYRRAPTVLRTVAFSAETLKRMHEALAAVVNEPGGTGKRARIPGFLVSGKTGTAQNPDGGEGKEHAWFTGYAPGKDPVVVVAVFVEHGGHGGEAAAPIARAIFEKALEKRGLKAPAPDPAALVASAVGPEAGPGGEGPAGASGLMGPPLAASAVHLTATRATAAGGVAPGERLDRR